MIKKEMCDVTDKFSKLRFVGEKPIPLQITSRICKLYISWGSRSSAFSAMDPVDGAIDHNSNGV